MAGFSYTGERMTQKIREAYLRAILRQNVAFFDNVGAGEVATRITADMNLIQVFLLSLRDFPAPIHESISKLLCIGWSLPESGPYLNRRGNLLRRNHRRLCQILAANPCHAVGDRCHHPDYGWVRSNYEEVPDESSRCLRGRWHMG